VVCSSFLSASHIVGGEVNYKFIAFNDSETQATFEITCIIYRDQSGIDFDQFAQFGIYKSSDDSTWTSYDVIQNIPINSVTPIHAPADPCRDQLLSNDTLEKGIYKFNLTLNITDNYYKIAYQKCCRNHTISNIQDPGSTGAVYEITISPIALKDGNNSPTFKSLPPTYICANSKLYYDHSAIDVDGDILRYKFCAPEIAGGGAAFEPECCNCQNPDLKYCPPPFAEVQYISPFSASKPLGGTPPIIISNHSGIITGKPTFIGSYVVAVCVEEIRNGIVISETKRDFEFNVVPCESALKAELIADTILEEDGHDVYVYKLCKGEEITIPNASQKPEKISSYYWKIKDAKNVTVQETFGITERDINCIMDAPGNYDGIMVINKNTICADTAFFKLEVFEEIKPNFKFTFDPCMPGPVYFANTSEFVPHDSIIWSWDFGLENAHIANPEFQYEEPGYYEVELHVKDQNGCNSSITKSINYNPDLDLSPPEIIQKDTVICNGDSILFFDKWIAESGVYNHVRPKPNNHCDSFYYELNAELSNYPILITTDTVICPDESIVFAGNLISTEGIYQEHVSSEILGCDSLTNILNLIISSVPSIEAVDKVEVGKGVETNINLDIDGEWAEVKWYPEYGLSCADCPSPDIYLENDQNYTVAIINKNGCADEFTFNLSVISTIDFYVPNIISPSMRNHKNHCFYIQSRDEFKYKYALQVFDRYGSLIFNNTRLTCNDSSQGWQPKNLNPGVFVYRIEFEENIEPKVLSGTITVLK